ncbi:hypothetical protein BDQ17DRAFT_1267558, partial [Cyathus striatus]
VFSSGKETMTPCYNRIRSDLMEVLQMLKFSFRNECHLNFTAGTSMNVELQDLEEGALWENFIPEELSSFVDSLHSACEDDNNEFSDSFLGYSDSDSF